MSRRAQKPPRSDRVRTRAARWWALTCVLVLLGLAGVTAVSTAQTAATDGTASTTESPPQCNPDAPPGTPDFEACPPGSSDPEPPPPPPPVKPPADPTPPAQAQVDPPPAPPPPAPESPTSVQSEPATTESESRPRPRRSCRKRDSARLSPAARRRAAAWRRKHCPRARRHGAGGDQAEDRKRSVKERRRRAARERRAALEERAARKQCKPAVAGELVPLDRIDQCRGTLDGGPTLVGRLSSKPLPDPLPPGSRLDEGFAQLLVRTAGPQWPLVLASLRAQGSTGPAPAEKAKIAELAKGLREAEAEERVQGLADYHRAAGIAGLTQGLTAVKGELIKRVLSDPKISIYESGRSDIASGDIDVRPLVVMLYLAERQGSVMVSSLVSGHGVFTKSGGISLHSFGRAMDISAVGGVPILGHQQPGGVTENALRNILMLPAELQPSELISLFAMGGPTLAMADHADHIHVGY